MSTKNWYVCIHGASLGPIETQVVHLMIEQKRLSPMEFAWCEGMTEWKRVCEIEELGGSAAVPEMPSIPVPAAAPKKAAPPAPPQAAAPAVPAPPVAPKAVTKPVAKMPAPIKPVKVATPPPPVAAAPAPAQGESLKEKMIAKAAQKKAGIAPKPYVTIRRAERVEIDGTLDIVGHGTFSILNMSAIGVLLSSKKSVPPGTNIKFKFECKEIKKSPLDMTGVVVRDGVAQGKEEIAIEFTRVNPAHKRALQDYVESKSNEGKATEAA